MLRRWFRVTRCVTQTALVCAPRRDHGDCVMGLRKHQGILPLTGKGRSRSGRYLNQGRSKATLVVPLRKQEHGHPAG
jgi:hypothetical protein